MPTDPYVPRKLEDEPRQLPNLAPGVKMPPAKSWRANRPGDLPAGQPHGKLLGSPGPNVGYALTLMNRVRDKLLLAPHEHVDDAAAITAELAMKRAASYGRAPVMTDIDVAMTLLGYKGDAPADFAEWRAHADHGARHHYDVRRALVDAAPLDIIRLRPDQLGGHADEFRQQLKTAAPIGA